MSQEAVVRACREIRKVDLLAPVHHERRCTFVNWLRDQLAMPYVSGRVPDWAIALSEIEWVRSEWPDSLLNWTPPKEEAWHGADNDLPDSSE